MKIPTSAMSKRDRNFSCKTLLIAISETTEHLHFPQTSSLMWDKQFLRLFLG